MKIVNIERDPEKKRVYLVTFRKRTLFKGFQEFTESFKESNEDVYIFRQSGYYLRPDGSELGNGHWIALAIDRFQKSW